MTLYLDTCCYKLSRKASERYLEKAFKEKSVNKSFTESFLVFRKSRFCVLKRHKVMSPTQVLLLVRSSLQCRYVLEGYKCHANFMFCFSNQIRIKLINFIISWACISCILRYFLNLHRQSQVKVETYLQTVLQLFERCIWTKGWVIWSVESYYEQTLCNNVL